MAELVDAPDLGSGTFECRGSSPLLRTRTQSQEQSYLTKIPAKAGIFCFITQKTSADNKGQIFLAAGAGRWNMRSGVRGNGEEDKGNK